METSISRTSTTQTLENLWQSIVIGMLQKMEKGRLELTLPGGMTISLGDGADPYHASMTIHDNEFFQRCVLYGDIGFGETYVDGLWDTPDITKVINWFLYNVDNAPTLSGSRVRAWAVNLLKIANRLSNLGRLNTRTGSKKNIREHYDLNNDFFALLLDPTMTYSAALFSTPGISLQEAQYAKYEALCQRVKLKSTDHVLEIGSGWGGNAIYMAKHYGCHVTTTTISEEQYKFAVQRVEKEGLSKQITVLQKDYRELEGQFDKIVSIEMLEAVGHKFLKSYFAKCHTLLKKNGLLGIQVIICPDNRYKELKNGIDWIQKHIFPGSLLPSVGAINKAVNDTGDMTLAGLQEMGLHYGKTLRLWYENFNEHWPLIKDLGFDDRFRRKWNYYLCYCESAFNMRNINVVQLVYTRPNNLGM